MRAALLIGLLALGACARLPVAELPEGDSAAALFLEDLVYGGQDTRLSARVPEPKRSNLDFTVDGRRAEADLYRPGEAPLGGLVLVPGLSREGKDERRIVGLAMSLARMRFLVLVPDIADLRRHRVRQRNIRQVADAFRYLRARPLLSDGHPVGIASASIGAGPSLIAALEPDIRDDVRFVALVGGYYHLVSLIRFYGSGTADATLPPAVVEQADLPNRLKPYRSARWLMALDYAELLENRSDQALLRRMARHSLRGRTPLFRDAARAGMGADALALLDLIENEDAARLPELVQRLPPVIRNELSAVSPASYDLSRLRARLILLHGREDRKIPATESLALAQALPPEQVQTFLVDGLQHVVLDLNEKNASQLLAPIAALLAQRASPRT